MARGKGGVGSGSVDVTEARGGGNREGGGVK